MKAFFEWMIIVEAVIMFYCAIKLGKRSGKIARIIRQMEGVAVLCSLSSVICSHISGDIPVLFFKGLSMACLEWFAILLMEYTEHYTGLFRAKRFVVFFMIAFASFNSVMFLINPWAGNVFTLANGGKEESLFGLIHGGTLYYLHFLYFYLAMLMVMVAFVFKIVTTSKFYRLRYTVLLVIIGIANGFDVIMMWNHMLNNESILIYGLLCIAIYYFSMTYIPDELVENTLSLVIRDLNSGLICFDNMGRCIFQNELAKILYVNNGDTEELEQNHRKWVQENNLNAEDTKKFSVTRNKDGNERYYEVVYKKVYDDKHNFICDYYLFNDQTEGKLSYERERFRATHDELTGLYNRERFYSEVAAMLEENPDREYYMVYSNVKDFKLINELFGIQKGDQVLKKQAEFMKKNMPQDSVYGRIRGDRFVLCLPKEECSRELLEVFLKEIQLDFENTSFHLHMCVGIYAITDRNEVVSIMCDKANIAATTVENNYQKNIAYYDEELLEKSVQEKKLINDFERAIVQNEFVMYLQPQVSSDGVMHGAEALVRWNHPKKGLLHPGSFIEVLEKTGLVYRLDMYVWEEAVKQLRRWKDIGKTSLHISVNISAKDFYYVDIYKKFTQLVKKYDIAPENLKLEITETALMTDPEKNMAVMERLRQEGFKMEIDDFGSGYSSLNMLKDISADVVKIDMGFLRASENEQKGKDILETIIVLTKKLGMEVITEGVEYRKQIDMLIKMGCDLFQGYYYSKPIPVREFEDKYHIA